MGRDAEWSPRIVVYKIYDLAADTGRLLAALIPHCATPPPNRPSSFAPLAADSRATTPGDVAVWKGRRAFSLHLLWA
jgi:hypothetical protein